MPKKLEYTELRSLDSTIEQLQELVDGLRTGVLRLKRGEQELLLDPGAVLDFTLCAERTGVRERLNLVLEWRRQDLTISTGRENGSPAPKLALTPAPYAGHAPALRAEAQPLEDDSQAPLSSDDDDTLAPDDVAEPDASRPSVILTTPTPIVQEQDEIDDEAVTVRRSSPPTGQLSALPRALDLDTEWLERLYWESRTLASDDRLHLDDKRFADSLAAAELEPQLQQELLTIARQADAEGRDRLFEQRSISELIATTLSGVA